MDSLKVSAVIGLTLIGLLAMAPPSYSQGAPQTISRITVINEATGFRTSKIVGSKVVNDRNDTIGTVDDVILTPNGTSSYAVLSIGGFLGMGNYLVAVPFANLKFAEDSIQMPGGSKEQLKSLPAFKYASR